ncbi:MAG TPA: tRNA (adenosine(37)-N6)-threonylcarbamoyltransferase complex dimerization subunit type 1 TsaB [Alphaproteobacteria bacterium]|jgi:tRNA threonylcarbamoyladenosine biosynthesis protein TsaB|nr:tRNA (adenosine(37)-N6)-threonylcarbamoyltransferase complex dimerization subunit type 1 TsaB [Alphaproteobacteria bacterium]
MRILAFDCAGAGCAAALTADGKTLAARSVVAERGHAQLLIPLLSDLLDEAGLTFGDIDRFAVTTGPGSFTGIRVALAAAHGLALGTGKPIVGVTVFEAMAAAAGAVPTRLLVAIDSRRAELFAQLFDTNGDPLTEPAMLPPGSVAHWTGPGQLSLTGDAAHLVAPHLAGMIDNPPESWAAHVDPETVARLVEGRPVGRPPAPFYLRAPDAVPAKV